MKKYLIAGLAAAGFVLATSGSALAGGGGLLHLSGPSSQANDNTLSNQSMQTGSPQHGHASDGEAGGNGVNYGESTFELMAGINSNGIGTVGGTGQSQVLISAAATINLSRGP